MIVFDDDLTLIVQKYHNQVWVIKGCTSKCWNEVWNFFFFNLNVTLRFFTLAPFQLDNSMSVIKQRWSVHLLQVVFFFFFCPLCLLPPTEPAGSNQAVLISQWVSGSLDPTWPPALLLLMSASCSRLKRVVFKQSPSLGPPRGAHRLRSLKGPYTDSTSGCFLAHLDLCFLTTCASAFPFYITWLYFFTVLTLVSCVACVTRIFLRQNTTSEANDSGWLDAVPGQDILACPPLLWMSSLWRGNRQHYEIYS